MHVLLFNGYTTTLTFYSTVKPPRYQNRPGTHMHFGRETLGTPYGDKISENRVQVGKHLPAPTNNTQATIVSGKKSIYTSLRAPTARERVQTLITPFPSSARK